MPPYLLPRWNRASSTAVLSSTVTDTTVTGTSAPRGKTPGTRSSCQSEWILQMSTESKYLPEPDADSQTCETKEHAAQILDQVRTDYVTQKPHSG